MKQTLLILCLILSACGKDKRHMYLNGVESLSPEEKEIVLQAVKEFNALAGENVLDINQGSFPISITVENQQTVNQIQPAVSTNIVRNGFAQHDGSECGVILSEDIFLPSKAKSAMSVILHEFGHCAGLAHADGNEDLMSPGPLVFSNYSKEAFEKFKGDIKAALGI